MPKLIAILMVALLIFVVAWQFLPTRLTEDSVKSTTSSTALSLSEQVDQLEIVHQEVRPLD